jgi:hypothetical protein
MRYLQNERGVAKPVATIAVKNAAKNFGLPS